MLTDLKRRDFFRSVILTTVGLLSKDLLFPSPARSNENQQLNKDSPIVENYLLFVPYITAKQGGKISVTLYLEKENLSLFPTIVATNFLSRLKILEKTVMIVSFKLILYTMFNQDLLIKSMQI
jgi:hypothetical protein